MLAASRMTGLASNLAWLTLLLATSRGLIAANISSRRATPWYCQRIGWRIIGRAARFEAGLRPINPLGNLVTGRHPVLRSQNWLAS
jgi:hypothetical protein